MDGVYQRNRSDGRWKARVVEAPLTLRVARAAVAAESLLLMVLVFVSGFRRLRYPYPLDWVEEGTLTEVGRVMHGLALYVAPTLHYTPYIYAPLFFWVSAAVAQVVGLGYPAMRLVSVGSTAGLFAALFGFVWFESPRCSRWLAALVGVGLFATASTVTGGFFDVGRVDMLCLMFTMMGLLLVRRELLVAAAFCFALAMLSKQGMLPIAVLALCSEWQRPRRLAVGLGSLAVFCGAPLLWLHHATGGWSTTFMFRVAAGFALDKRQLVFVLPHEVFPAALLSLALVVGGALVVGPRRLGRGASFFVLTGLAMVPYTAYLRAHAGAAINADMPAWLWIAFTAAICFGRLYERSVADALGGGRAATLSLLAVPLLQMLVYTYGPQFLVPLKEKTALREHVIAQVHGMPGDVLMIDHPQYSLAAGKEVYADGKALDGLITSPRLPFGGELKAQLAELVRERHFSALVVDGPLENALVDDRLPTDFRRFYPVRGELATFDTTDQLTEPSWVFLPCRGASGMDARQLLPGVALDETACGDR